MWVDEMCWDPKDCGARVETTSLVHADRLDWLVEGELNVRAASGSGKPRVQTGLTKAKPPPCVRKAAILAWRWATSSHSSHFLMHDESRNWDFTHLNIPFYPNDEDEFL